jgi:hypothetical protein
MQKFYWKKRISATAISSQRKVCDENFTKAAL